MTNRNLGLFDLTWINPCVVYLHMPRMTKLELNMFILKYDPFQKA
jgi:hypothetical protein